MLNAIKHTTDDKFFFNSGRQHIGALCVQHSPTAAVLSTSFLLNHAPQQPWAVYESWVKKIEEIKQSALFNSAMH